MFLVSPRHQVELRTLPFGRIPVLSLGIPAKAGADTRSKRYDIPPDVEDLLFLLWRFVDAEKNTFP